ncbi:unnamed protein product, partial [Brassica rapa]
KERIFSQCGGNDVVFLLLVRHYIPPLRASLLINLSRESSPQIPKRNLKSLFTLVWTVHTGPEREGSRIRDL